MNSEKVVKLVDKYLGHKERPKVRDLKFNVPRLTQDKYCGYTDNIYLYDSNCVSNSSKLSHRRP